MEIIETEKSIEIKGLFDVAKNPGQIEWQEYTEGISVYPLYEDESGASAILFRLKAGTATPKHLHTGYEHVFLLSGKNSKIWEPGDQESLQHKGDMVIAKPGTRHSVYHHEDGIALIIFQKPVRFDL